MKNFSLLNAGASALAGAHASRVLETKDDGTGVSDGGNGIKTDDAEVKAAVTGLVDAQKAFQEKVMQEIEQIKTKGTADAVTKDELKTLTDDLSKFERVLDEYRAKQARPMVEDPASGEKRALTDIEVKHRDGMREYIRSGEEKALTESDEVKALSVGSDPDGGYTVTPQMDAEITRVITRVSPVRQIANVVSISSSSLKSLKNVGGTASGWVSESGGRPQTDGSTLRELKIEAHEMYAQPSATQSLLDDSAVNIEAWMAGEVDIEFARLEGSAFVNGDGAGKPRGFIGGYDHVANSDSFSEAATGLGYVDTGANGAFDTTEAYSGVVNLIDLVHALKPEYRGNANFTMADSVLAQVRKFVGSDGQFYYNPSLSADMPSTFLGHGVRELADMPDVGTGSFSVAFGDFNAGYRIVDRIGTRVLRDPFTAKPFVLFYTTRRVGGAVRMKEAIKLLRFSA